MTNIIAIFLGIFILGFLAVDYLVYDWAMLVFVVRKLLALTAYIAFWR